jgi:phosphoribosylglycinamide formyltransferase 1
MTHRIAVLTSGPSRGSNFEAMVEWFHDHRKPVEVAFLGVTKADAPVVERARRWRIPVFHASWCDQGCFERSVLERMKQDEVELLALAGFMKLVSREFLEQAGVPVLNIHPALLPAHGGQGMYGMNVHNAVFQAHEEYSGVTIHKVDDRYDAGEIVAQEQVWVGDCKTPQEIALRVLAVEHRLYAETISKILENCD